MSFHPNPYLKYQTDEPFNMLYGLVLLEYNSYEVYLFQLFDHIFY